MMRKNFVTNKNVIFVSIICFILLALIIIVGMLTPLFVKIISGSDILLDATYFNQRAALPTIIIVSLLALYLLNSMIKPSKSLIILGCILLLSFLNIIISPFKNPIIDASVIVIIPVIAIVLYKILITVTDKNNYVRNRALAAHVIHIGILFVLLGIVLSSAMKIEKSTVYNNTEMKNTGLEDYDLKITSMKSYFQGEPYKEYNTSEYVTTVNFDIYKKGLYLRSGSVDYINDFKWGQTYTTTYIHRRLMEELFIVPRAVDPNNMQIDLYVRIVPYINLLWGGIYTMVLGIIALLIVEYKQKPNIEPPSLDKFSYLEDKYDTIMKNELKKARIKGGNT